VPDLIGYVLQDGSMPSIDSLISWNFTKAVKGIVAEEMTVEGFETIIPGKVDFLSIHPLLDSETKRLVLYIYLYPHEERRGNLLTMAQRIKAFDDCFEPEGCVAVSFRPVKLGDWVKA